MLSQSAVALFLSLSSNINIIVIGNNFVRSETPQQSTPSWHKFGSNVNYRITAILDINGGASNGPDFESFTTDANSAKRSVKLQDDASSSTKATNTPAGYSVPINVLTLQDPTTGTWRQRISYYSGTQVDYNVDGEGYKVISKPFTGSRSTPDERNNHDGKKHVCLYTGGNSTIVEEKVGYLNFFPTVEQMENYTFGKLITTEPGIPFRITSLEAPHGTYDATSETTQPDASYDAQTGMPNNDWFQFHYQESLSYSSLPGTTTEGAVASPLKWTMLARNQIINAHTENWVLRYLSYEPVGKDDERKLWESWFDMQFRGACGEDESDHTTLVDRSHGRLQLNRLGMFFSSSSHSPRDISAEDALVSAALPTEPSHFDLFLARHNKHYPHPHEYSKRREIHDRNTKNIETWNSEHAGKTSFAANEFMDLEVKEVMAFRGGHVPHGKSKLERRAKLEQHGDDDENKRHHLRQSSSTKQGSRFLLGDTAAESSSSGGDEYSFTPYEVPKDFDPSTLPESFDWRDHLPGSVSPIKDQGFCGSCWAFSFISALESHWFIANGKSVDLPEQFINDCAWSDAAHACDGGDASYAAKQIIDRFQGMVPTRDVYGGYLSVDGSCYVDILQEIGMMGENFEVSSSPSSMVQLTDWVVLPPRDDTAIKHALFTKGPLAIALNVVDEAMYYASGVLDVESCIKHGTENLDHAINLVGWGTDVLPDGTKAEHWILRNSWSDLWGDSGYFKVRMGERDCGVTTSAGYPVVGSSNPKIMGKHLLVEPSENVALS